MPIEAATYNVLQLGHLTLEGTGMVKQDNGTLGKIADVSLRWQIFVGAIDSREWTKRAAAKEELV